MYFILDFFFFFLVSLKHFLNMRNINAWIYIKCMQVPKNNALLLHIFLLPLLSLEKNQHGLMAGRHG